MVGVPDGVGAGVVGDGVVGVGVVGVGVVGAGVDGSGVVTGLALFVTVIAKVSLPSVIFTLLVVPAATGAYVIS